MQSLVKFVKSHTPSKLFPFAQKVYFFLCSVPFALRVYFFFRSIPYAGDQFHCPVCKGNFRGFLVYREHEHARPNPKCPRCDTLDRQRLTWLYLQDCTNLFHDKLKVLHFAPEYAFEQRLRACPNLNYTTTDLYRPAMVKADITALPFADNTFDVILCTHVLEHIPDDRQAMSELSRVLKCGGWAILLVPIDMNRTTTFEDPTVTDPKERLRLFDQEDHVRIYGRDYVNRLEQAGFAVRVDDYAHELDPSIVERSALSADIMFYCTK